MSHTAELPQFLCLENYDLPRDTLSECKHLFFTPKTVAAAISKRCSKDNIKGYLQSHERETVERQISDNIHGRHSVIFYAAKRNAFDILRQRQLARLLGCPRILNLPFHIVGQDHTLEVVMDKILAYDAMNRKRPLVLAFAGLSGHGKTELATSLGSLMGTDVCNIDMSKTHHVMSLFGAAAPYYGSDEGSPLNNYLASHTGKRCVVFLDEFDKTTREVREPLLTILDTGVGMDLRTNTVTDVTKSVWILASNRGDDLISKFYNKNLKGKSDRERRQVSIKPLQHELYRLFIESYTVR